MQDVLYIEELAQATALLTPMRVDVLKSMAEPVNCTELGERLGKLARRRPILVAGAALVVASAGAGRLSANRHVGRRWATGSAVGAGAGR